MEDRIKIDAGTTAFGGCADRFVRDGYKISHAFEKQLELLSGIEGITGVALDYPTQYEDPGKLRKLLDNTGLELGMTEIDMYSSSKWKYGSLTANDAGIRREAVDLVKRGIDAAIEAGGADVQLWLGQDGYEYPFQSNFDDCWKRLLDGIAEVAAYRGDMKITVEYKIKEPRARCYIAGIGHAMFICERVKAANLGITLDVGHSLMALENPAESAVIAMQSGRLFHLHLNDNYRDWDHDMVIGTVNLWNMVEMFYWLEKMSFDGWYGIDIYPYREEGAKALSRTVKNIYRLREIARSLMKTDLAELQQRDEVMDIIDILWKEVLA